MEIATNPPLFADLARQQPETAAGTTAGADATASADFSSFLRLLTAQLRNQDPLQPLDSTQFVAQLASFSTVEQLIGANDRLDRLASLATADQAAAFAGWIGQEVSGIDGGFLATGAEQGFQVPAEAGADRVVARILRADGTVLRELALPGGAAQQAVWDGLDAAGAAVAGIPLTVALSYYRGEELVVERPAEVFRRVTGLRGTAEGALLELADGDSLAPERVAGLRAPVGDGAAD